MLFLLSVVLLIGTALLYLSDRQQRALAQPLPAAARLAGAILVVGGFAGWAWVLGPGVGLFTACWVFALGAMLPPMLVGHRVDSYRAARRHPAGRHPAGRRGARATGKTSGEAA